VLAVFGNEQTYFCRSL